MTLMADVVESTMNDMIRFALLAILAVAVFALAAGVILGLVRRRRARRIDW